MRDLSPEVRKFAEARGLTPDQVREMVRLAAPCSHARGNRRYHDYVFQIEGRNIVAMSDMVAGLHVDSHPPKDVPLRDDEFVQYEDCEACDAKGCSLCNYEGEVRYVRRLPKRNQSPMR